MPKENHTATSMCTFLQLKISTTASFSAWSRKNIYPLFINKKRVGFSNKILPLVWLVAYHHSEELALDHQIYHNMTGQPVQCFIIQKEENYTIIMAHDLWNSAESQFMKSSKWAYFICKD